LFWTLQGAFPEVLQQLHLAQSAYENENEASAAQDVTYDVRLHLLEDKLRLLDTPPQGTQKVVRHDHDPLLELELQLAELEVDTTRRKTSTTTTTSVTDRHFLTAILETAHLTDTSFTLGNVADTSPRSMIRRELLAAEEQRRLELLRQRKDDDAQLNRLRAKGFSGIHVDALSKVSIY
jgi:hypothetical protein